LTEIKILSTAARFFKIHIDNLVKSLEIVMPDPVSGTGQARSGIQNVLNLLDSGFRRNDGKGNFLTFYESIHIGFMEASIVCGF